MCYKIQTRYLVLICIIFLFFLFGSFYDLSISNECYIGQLTDGNIFGIIFSYIGVIPTFLGWSFLGTIILYLTRNVENNKKKTFYKSIAIFQYVLSFFFFCNAIMMTNKTDFSIHWLIAYSIGIIFILLSMLFGYRFAKNSNNENLLNDVLFISIISIITMAIIMITKYSMARPRYRFVLELKDYKYFINWWENGHALKNSIVVSEVSDEFTSFPSGHSAYSLFAIFIFPFLMKKNNGSIKYEQLLFIAGIIWWILTAYSRITVGAHYLTDVCFGGIVTLISYIITTLIFKKIYKKA